MKQVIDDKLKKNSYRQKTVFLLKSKTTLGPPRTREIVIGNYLYSATKTSRQLLVLIEDVHTLEAKIIDN